MLPLTTTSMEILNIKQLDTRMETAWDFWDSIIGHVVSLLSGAAALKLLDHFLKKKAGNTKDLYFNLSKLQELHAVMESVVKETGADRFLILKGSNGGGLPKPGSPFFVSVLHGVDVVNGVERAMAKYQQIMADAHYLEMLTEILVRESTYMEVSKMPDSMLKRIYDAEGVRHSIVFIIAKTKTELIYGSIASHSEDCNFQKHTDKINIEIGIGQVRNIFAAYKTGSIL